MEPTEKDVMDYFCFLAKTGGLPVRTVAKTLHVSKNSIKSRAEKGALWIDHFLAVQKRQIQEIRESDLNNFDIEELPDNTYLNY